jgi:predicted lipoprotein with Yx(FWY)xxD motif
MKSVYLALVLSAMAVMAAPAHAGQHLTDSKGMTVYTYDPDGVGVSNCYDGCAKAWPPVAATGAIQAPFSEITRKDGAKQLAYDGHPLYTYIGDTKPGDDNGDGLDGVWHDVDDDDSI